MKKMVKNKNKIKKTPLIVIGAIILCAVVTLAYIYVFNGTIFGWSNHSSDNQKTTTGDQKNTTTTDEQKSTGDTIKQASIENNDQSSTPAPTTNSKTATGVSITTANQAGAVFQIRAQISAVTNSGVCTLTLTKGSAIVTKTAGVQALASTSTCQGFNIDTSELSVGKWQLQLDFENDTYKGSASQTITVT